jgi:hypothetical protein
LRGVGNTRIPFFVAVVANVINAVLNYALILGNFGAPALGVTGSALGTVIAQFINMVILMVILRRETIPNLKLPLKPRSLDHGLAGELFRIGWPAALDMLILNAGFLTALGQRCRSIQRCAPRVTPFVAENRRPGSMTWSSCKPSASHVRIVAGGLCGSYVSSTAAATDASRCASTASMRAMRSGVSIGPSARQMASGPCLSIIRSIASTRAV